MTLYIPIIYEDTELLVIDKPSGVAVHAGPAPTYRSVRAGPGVKEEVITDWLVEHIPRIKEVGDPSTGSGQEIWRPGIVHRLDKETSGVMVIAKDQPTFVTLKELFKNRLIEKKYLALVCHPMKEKSGVIETSLARSKKFGKFSAKESLHRGKVRQAKTIWTLKKNLPEHAWLELEPKTGRTHQLRVHLASTGHPIAGDQTYGGKNCAPKGLNRLFLHASSLSFSLGKQRFLFEATLPQDLKNILETLGYNLEGLS